MLITVALPAGRMSSALTVPIRIRRAQVEHDHRQPRLCTGRPGAIAASARREGPGLQFVSAP